MVGLDTTSVFIAAGDVLLSPPDVGLLCIWPLAEDVIFSLELVGMFEIDVLSDKTCPAVDVVLG